MADKTLILKNITEDSANQAALKEKKDKINADYQSEVQKTKDTYQQENKEAFLTAQEKSDQTAAVYEANRHRIAEQMANRGLSNSGLSEMSLKNNSAALNSSVNKINLDRKAQSEALENQKEETLNKLNTEKEEQLAKAQENWEKANEKEANQVYKAQVAAEKAEEKAKAAAKKTTFSNSSSSKKESATQNDSNEGGTQHTSVTSVIISKDGALLSRKFSGTLKDNGVTVTYNSDGTTTYYDRYSGKTSTFAMSVNPYTGNDNAKEKDTDTGKAWKKYGFFQNGYQPKGVFRYGVDYGWVSSTGILTVVNGTKQIIHKTFDGSLWVWDGAQNRYIRYQGTLDMSKFNKD